MDGENVSKPYSPLTETRSLFNNPKQSDVRFLIEGQTLYGHKFILGMGSPVFNRMFFGDLKEKREVIEIEDLSFVGFKNALRYIYGFPIDFELFDLYESYMAADKYLLHHFGEAFIEYVKSRRTVESSCLIYDQLMKIGEREEISLADVRTVIIKNSRATFESKHFTQIDQETLISLLSLDRLNIVEFDLLIAVSKWVDCEVQRQGLQVNGENRRKVFEPIKSYILFTALTAEQVANCKELAELLTSEEVGSLLWSLMNKAKPLKIELKTARRIGATNPSVFVDAVSCSSANGRCIPATTIDANRRVAIHAIHTLYSFNANLSLRIYSADGIELSYIKKEYSAKDGKWSVLFEPPFMLEPDKVVVLIVIGHDVLKDGDQLSKQTKLTWESVTFTLANYSGYHCLRGLEFSTLD